MYKTINWTFCCQNIFDIFCQDVTQAHGHTNMTEMQIVEMIKETKWIMHFIINKNS